MQLFEATCGMGFPGGPVVKNPPANPGDMSLIPGLGRSHMPRGNSAWGPQLLSLRALEHMLCTEKSQQQEAHVPRKSSPHSPQLERAWVQQQRLSSAKNIWSTKRYLWYPVI